MNKGRMTMTYTIFLLSFVCSVGMSTQGFMLSSFIDHYALAAASQGLVSSFSSFGCLIAMACAGFFIGRVKKTSMSLVCICAFAVAFLLISFAPPFAVLLSSYLLFGLSLAMLDATNNSLIADLHAGENSSRYLNAMHGVFGVGGLLSPLLFAALMAMGLSWNGVFRILFVFVLIVLAFYVFVSRKTANALPAQPAGIRKLRASDYWTFIKTKTNILLLLCCAFFAVHQLGFSLWIKRYVTDYLSGGELGTLCLSLFWVGTAACRLLLSRLRFAPQKLILVGMLLAALFVVLGVLSGSAVVMVVFAFLIGFANGATLPMLIYLGCRWNTNTMLTTSLLMLFFNVAAMLCAPLVGAIVAGSGITAGMMVFAVTAVLSALCIAPILKTSPDAAPL